MTTPSAPPPGQPILPRPEMPPANVPDDAIHGDDLDAARQARVLAQQAGGTAPPPPTVPASAPASAPPVPSRPYAPRRGGRRPWLLVAAAGGALVVGSLNGLLHNSSDQTETLHRTVERVVVADVGSMDIEIVSGTSAGSVEVTRRATWGIGGAPRPAETWDGTTLRIGDPECSGFGSCSIDYVLKVPQGTVVDLETGSGDIAVSGTLGGVTLRTGSGDIEAGGLTAPALSTETGSGDVDVDLDNAPGSVTIKTGSGDVELRVPDEQRYAIAGESGSGDREIGVDNDPSSQHHLTIDTGSGDVEVDGQ